MDGLFLDANVLFSGAYREGAGLLRLWEMAGIELVTSVYALEEARRNLREPEQRGRLDRLARRLVVAAVVTPHPTVDRMPLAGKDRPILSAAIHAGATHLITGDVRHFGRWFGERVEGVLILPPSGYLTPSEG